jgi:hypothetical protein
MEKTIILEGSPKFISESSESGLFRLVRKLSFKEGDSSWTYNFHDNGEDAVLLRKGLDTKKMLFAHAQGFNPEKAKAFLG